MEKFYNLKLGKKLTILIGIAVAIILTITTIITATRVNTITESGVLKQFNTQTEYNAFIIQSLIQDACNIIGDARDHVANEYHTLKSADEASIRIDSTVYGYELAQTNYNLENYILNLTSIAAINNPNIYSINTYFEPYAFDPTKQIYGFTIEQTNSFVPKPITQYSTYSNEEFYAIPKNTLDVHVTQPRELSDGTRLISITYPIVANNSFKGAIVANIISNNLETTDINDPDLPTAFSNIFSNTLNIVHDSRSTDYIGTHISNLLTPQSFSHIEQLTTAGKTFSTETSYQDGSNHLRIFAPVKVGNDIWWASSGVEPSDLYSDATAITFLVVSVSVISLLVLVTVVKILVDKLLLPLDNIVDAAGSIKKGNLDITLDITSEDEIGSLARRFVRMAEKLKGIIHEIEYVLGEMAKGDFTVINTMNAKYDGQFAPIKTSLITISETLSSSLKNINQSAEEVSQGAGEISSGTSELAKSTIEQSQIIENFVVATDEIAHHITNTMEQFKESEIISNEAKQKAHNGAHTMSNMLTSMDAINESSQKISEVLKTVESIADQTSLLALNATIEAARAGEAGKGFAVVANEIRELADRSTESVKEIEEVIKTSIHSVEEGQAMANETADSLQDIVETVEKNASITKKLLETSKEQQQSISELADGTKQIAALVQTNSATTEESASISEDLAQQAQNLKQSLSYFKFN
ncbi:MAG: hypothetical protein ATN36_04460 [Epulopiscium sp. Nele67-Bin005]|nr:MAG: hypothetical protein ATN36_04460 [Epulopiscium sp. Nele67-Bin005]